MASSGGGRRSGSMARLPSSVRNVSDEESKLRTEEGVTVRKGLRSGNGREGRTVSGFSVSKYGSNDLSGGCVNLEDSSDEGASNVVMKGKRVGESKYKKEEKKKKKTKKEKKMRCQATCSKIKNDFIFISDSDEEGGNSTEISGFGEKENNDEKVKEEEEEEVKGKGKQKEKGAVSESVQIQTSWFVREGHEMRKKRPRKKNALELCPAWRTRSYKKSEPERTNYTQYYKKLDSDSETSVYDIEDSDSESESNKRYEDEEEEESESDSDSDSYTDSDSSGKGSSKEENRGSSERERRTNEKSGGRHKRRYEKRTRKHADERENVERDDNADRYSSSNTDELPLLERIKKLNKHGAESSSKHRARKGEGKKKYNRDSVEISLPERKRKYSKQRARDSDEQDSQEGRQKTKKNKAKKKKKTTKSERGATMDELMDLVNMINDGEDGSESSRRNNSPQELPMVFRWETDEESEEEKKNKKADSDDFEDLWKDYEFALRSENLGTYNADEAQGPIYREHKDAVYIASGDYCINGLHDIYLDEQIGLRCRHCSYVETDIRDVMPAFAPKHVNRGSGAKNQTNLNDLFNLDSFQETTNDQDRPGPSVTKTGTVWDLIPDIMDTMYPHQKEAYEFMWRNLAGGIELDNLTNGSPRSDNVGGCVISHAPGTGKTRLAIIFIQSYMKAFPSSKPVVIAPAGMMHTWENEFRKWEFDFQFHNMNSEDFTGKEDERFLRATRGVPKTKYLVRQTKLYSWSKGNCVLGISYSLFNKYITHESNANSKEREFLVNKPSLLILDEGHIPRNEKSSIWNAFSEVLTDNRIILSGTPFQNNFLELYNSLCIVRPKFAQKVNVPKAKKKGLRDVWNTTTENITPELVNEARSILMPFVHVHTGTILQSLPGLRESIIMLNPEKIQKDTIHNLGTVKNNSTLDMDFRMSLASVHPYLLTSVSKLSEMETTLLNVPLLKTLKDDPYKGVKTKFVVEFVRLCESLEERVLVFSQYIDPLKLIEKYLMDMFNWTNGREVLQIYGRVLAKERQGIINKFNDMGSEAKVLLASTRSCSEGISLTGASRVVLLDVVWNPSVGKQAISRAFRIGQKKVVYTYNLIMNGTGEMEKYDVQGKKEKLSKLVFSPNGEAGTSKGGGLMKGWHEGDGDACKMVSDDRILEEITHNEKLKDMFANIYYIKSDDWHD